MDSFHHSRELTGIWVEGTEVVANAIGVYAEPAPGEKPAELRIAKHILAHELRECGVDFADNLVAFVRKDLDDCGSTAFQGYVTIASAAKGRPRAPRRFWCRTFASRERREPELLLRRSERVEDSSEVVVIKA